MLLRYIPFLLQICITQFNIAAIRKKELAVLHDEVREYLFLCESEESSSDPQCDRQENWMIKLYAVVKQSK
jgi:hypothetical protein